MRTYRFCLPTAGLCFSLLCAPTALAQQAVDVTAIGPAPNGESVVLGGLSNGVKPQDATTIIQTQLQTGAVRQDLDRRINNTLRSGNQGSAAVAAMVSAIRTPSPGKSVIGIAGGYYGGQAGIAAGLAHRSRDSKWHSTAVVAAPATMVSGANLAASAGVGFEF